MDRIYVVLTRGLPTTARLALMDNFCKQTLHRKTGALTRSMFEIDS